MESAPSKDFLADLERRPLHLAPGHGLRPESLFIGKGSNAVEVVLLRGEAAPPAAAFRALWRERSGGRASPLLLVVLYDGSAALCGPAGRQPPVHFDLDREQVERICRRALEEPDRHCALRFLHAAIPEVEAPVPGLRNEGLLATHELVKGVPKRPDWAAACGRTSPLTSDRGPALLRGLGFEIRILHGPASILLAGPTKVAVAVFLERTEVPEVATGRFGASSPVSYALAQADAERVDYVVLSTGPSLRLYCTKPGVGTGHRGRAETFFEIDLELLRRAETGYLWLLFSAEALKPAGTFQEILEASARYAADLGERLRDRIYDEVVPPLATAIAAARGLRNPSPEALALTYEIALLVLFRLLFVAYAEDKELLPFKRNDLYRARSLKRKADELLKVRRAGAPHAGGATHWEEVVRLFNAVNEGNPEWGVPCYDGALFSSEREVSEAGAEVASLTLENETFVPILEALLLDETPDGTVGPVDFRSLGVREFGTIYEGLLVSELSVAEVDLALDAEGSYRLAREGEKVAVRKGRAYPHDSSGARRATGSFYTKEFAVEHLLDHALEPALEEHLARLDHLDEREAAEALFDFRVADIAMGSGHFLVAAVDRVERGISTYLSKRPLPGVLEELTRLRKTALDALGDLADGFEIEDGQLLRRQIARRCIYGVDLNPMAVDLARLSLWIHTFVPGLPLSFLDHNLVRGNSLVGIATFDEVRELAGKGAGPLYGADAEEFLSPARAALEELGRLSDSSAKEIRAARKAHAEAREALAPTTALFDVFAASRLEALSVSDAIKSFSGRRASLPGSEIHEDAIRLLERTKPLHFPIAFPEVFLRERSGFDVILGNPPWEEASLEEDDFWTRIHPGFQALAQGQQERLKEKYRKDRPDLVRQYEEEVAETELVRRVLITGPFPGMGKGDPDLYKAFCWRFWHLVARPGGRVAVVLPRSAFAAKGSEEFRKRIFVEGRVSDLTFLLNNRQWIFEDVHPQYSITLCSLEKTAPDSSTTLPLRGPFSNLMRFRAGVKRDPVRFPVAEMLRWTDTAALPLLPVEESAAVFAQIRKAPRLDLDNGKSWRARPYAELHATNDKPLMKFAEKPPKGHRPVFKGESFDIWQPDTGKYYAYAEPKTVVSELIRRCESGKRKSNSPFSEFGAGWEVNEKTIPYGHCRVAFRDVSRATDSRTVRAALLPPGVAITNTAPYLLWPRGDEKDQAFLLGVLCSIPLDWYARRFVETHVNYHIFNALPITRPPRTNPLWKRAVALAGRLACPDERFAAWAKAVGVRCGPLKPDEEEDMIAELDAVVANLYGLSEEHVRHVFETFHEGWDCSERLEAVLRHFRAWVKRVA